VAAVVVAAAAWPLSVAVLARYAPGRRGMTTRQGGKLNRTAFRGFGLAVLAMIVATAVMVVVGAPGVAIGIAGGMVAVMVAAAWNRRQLNGAEANTQAGRQ
jgi:hypothetical protein